jgi:hypothetical protein
MPRRLLLINVVLALVSVLCIGIIVKQATTTRTVPAPRNRPAAASPGEPAATSDARPGAQAYNVIAARNLFSPTRSETAGPATGAGSAPALIAKPSLHGVVLRDGSPIAYLEDPLTKRIAGYRIGDPIAGGTVQTISADAVVISRPDGMVDVRLRDPSKPRPAPPPAVQQPAPGQPQPGQLPDRGAVPVPGPTQVPPRTFTPPATAPQPVPPQAIQPPAPGQPIPMPFGRPSPSLGRRMPPIPQDPSGQPLPAQNQQ